MRIVVIILTTHQRIGLELSRMQNASLGAGVRKRMLNKMVVAIRPNNLFNDSSGSVLCFVSGFVYVELKIIKHS